MIISESNLDKKITLRGKPMLSKAGPLLVGDGFEIFMQDFDDWPDLYTNEAANNSDEMITIIGTLSRDNGLPVFIHKPGDPQRTGIPVAPGTDIKKASQRFVLTKIKLVLPD